MRTIFLCTGFVVYLSLNAILRKEINAGFFKVNILNFDLLYVLEHVIENKNAFKVQQNTR